jgi:hypothetical protein
MDTDMTRVLDVPKADPADIARIALKALDEGREEIVADEPSRQVKAALSGGLELLYPQLAPH